MSNFHEVRFPTSVSLGSSGGPTRRTDIVTLANGFEERNAHWQHSRRRYEAGYGIKSLDDLNHVITFFEARLGQLYGFRWKDYSDYKSCLPSQTPSEMDQNIGTANGSTTVYQLRKQYTSGGTSYNRPINKPVNGSVVVAVDGALVTPTIDTTTGKITFDSPPSTNSIITAGFEFDVPVRFDTDSLDINLTNFDSGDIPSVPIMEVRV